MVATGEAICCCLMRDVNGLKSEIPYAVREVDPDVYLGANLFSVEWWLGFLPCFFSEFAPVPSSRIWPARHYGAVLDITPQRENCRSVNVDLSSRGLSDWRR